MELFCKQVSEVFEVFAGSMHGRTESGTIRYPWPLIVAHIKRRIPVLGYHPKRQPKDGSDDGV